MCSKLINFRPLNTYTHKGEIVYKILKKLLKVSGYNMYDLDTWLSPILKQQSKQ